METIENKNLTKKRIFLSVIILIIITVILVFIVRQKNNNIEKENYLNSNQSNGQVVGDSSANATVTQLEDEENFNQEGLKVVVPGSNPINVDNVVLAKNGQPAKNDASIMSDEAPQQTGFLNKSTLPDDLLEIEIGRGLINPKSFTTQAGAPTSFALSGIDNLAHTIIFDDPSLSAIVVSVGPSQTKAITFNAPTEPGVYTFYCLSSGHAERGERGEMIVE